MEFHPYKSGKLNISCHIHTNMHHHNNLKVKSLKEIVSIFVNIQAIYNNAIKPSFSDLKYNITLYTSITQIDNRYLILVEIL